MKAYLIYVDAEKMNSNKFYNMELVGSTINVEYGRVGSSSTKVSYPASKWNSLLKSKTSKGYKDITDLKTSVEVVVRKSTNKDFNEFYDVFSKYTGNYVKHTYSVEKATKAQLQEAQGIINYLSTDISILDFNKYLIELYKVIPRKMSDVRNHLLKDITNKNKIISLEQDNIDSMDSYTSMNVENPFDELDIDFELINVPPHIKTLYDMGTNGRYKIYKCYKIIDKTNINDFNNWLDKQDNKNTMHLIHGTRNPNVFNILKSGLLIRPSNAAVISGAAYGEGIYHSAHTAKSLGYTGYDNDKIFFIQNVHMGNHYTYNGWYKDGKDINRNQMNYKDLKALGYDSLYVRPGDGLQNSEYIVYNKEQSITEYLLWLK
jgi:poly [ADP-ribose] polymerase